MTEPEVTCWWCGKLQSRVKKMIVAGGSVPKPEAAICNECVELCMQILAMEDVGWRDQQVEVLKQTVKPPEGDENSS